MAIQTQQAQKKLQQSIRQIKKDMAAETKALAKGLYIAMSNANIKKGSGKPPKPGSKKAGNGDWVKGRELKIHYYVKGKGERWEPVSKWIDKLKQKNFTETYVAKNGKTRKRRVSNYKMIPFGNQHEPLKIFEHEMWRKGSKSGLPYSWGGDGLANYYLRKQWRTEVDDDTATVRISPARFKGAVNTDKVMQLLNEGGMEKGSKQLIGFLFMFNRLKSGKTGITAVREYAEKRPLVRAKGYNLKKQVVNRINRILKRVRPTQITNQHWRQIGRGK